VVWLYTYRRFNHAFHLENLPLKEIKVHPKKTWVDGEKWMLGWWKKMRCEELVNEWDLKNHVDLWDFCPVEQ